MCNVCTRTPLSLPQCCQCCHAGGKERDDTGSWLAALAAAHVPLQQLRLRNGAMRPGETLCHDLHSLCVSARRADVALTPMHVEQRLYVATQDTTAKLLHVPLTAWCRHVDWQCGISQSAKPHGLPMSIPASQCGCWHGFTHHITFRTKHCRVINQASSVRSYRYVLAVHHRKLDWCTGGSPRAAAAAESAVLQRGTWCASEGLGCWQSAPF